LKGALRIEALNGPRLVGHRFSLILSHGNLIPCTHLEENEITEYFHWKNIINIILCFGSAITGTSIIGKLKHLSPFSLSRQFRLDFMTALSELQSWCRE
jgi:hypothetical protein